MLKNKSVQMVIDQMQHSYKLYRMPTTNEGMVRDPRTGREYAVTEAGLHALKLIQAGATTTDAAAVLSSEHNVPVEFMEISLESFLMQVGRYMH